MGNTLKAGSINLGSFGNSGGVNADKKVDSTSKGRAGRGLDGIKLTDGVDIY